MFDLNSLNMNDYTYQNWLDYFKKNRLDPLVITFSKSDNLNQEEYDRIFPSIRLFQKGESSNGQHLKKVAHQFGQEKNQPLCDEVIDLFIKEENCHSAYLKVFMDHHRTQDKHHSLLDFCFRTLRKKGNFQQEILVLVTAEMIALNYYSALSKNTNSPSLQVICERMLHDEMPHIVFQSYQLSHFSKRKEWKRKTLMIFSSTLQYLAHYPIYKNAKISYKQFLKTNMEILQWSIDYVRERSKNV